MRGFCAAARRGPGAGRNCRSSSRSLSCRVERQRGADRGLPRLPRLSVTELQMGPLATALSEN